MLKHLRRITTELLHKNPWWEYRRDEYLHPEGSQGEFFYVHTRGAVFVIPELADGRLMMLRQFRYLNQRESLEFVGGGVKEGKSREESAREELLEEAGYQASELIPLGWFNPMNGASDEECYVYLARGLVSGEAKPEASEEFEPVLVTFDELVGLICSGEVWDGMTLAAFALYRCIRNL
ncbi:MAG TPA: NUDIX hydrolase [Candidatus Kapabacteria bacterium]|jgi:ADP-ribose pyrophosphatase|nr:NUDIX hydrolase [Candidatus Kapabacteria bacterium]